MSTTSAAATSLAIKALFRLAFWIHKKDMHAIRTSLDQWIKTETDKRAEAQRAKSIVRPPPSALILLLLLLPLATFPLACNSAKLAAAKTFVATHDAIDSLTGIDPAADTTNAKLDLTGLDATSLIPGLSQSTDTKPAPTNPVPATTPSTTSTNTTPAKPLPYIDTTIRYSPADSGVDQPCFTATRWSSGKPGDTCDSKNGQEIPTSATWSIVGTNYPCQVENGWWFTPAVKASGLINPIAITIVAKSGTYLYTIPQPSISGKSIKPVKQ